MSIILSMLVNSMVLFLRQFMSIKTSIIVNSMVYCLRLKSDTSLETSYNKFGFILKTIYVNYDVNYRQFDGLLCICL